MCYSTIIHLHRYLSRLSGQLAQNHNAYVQVMRGWKKEKIGENILETSIKVLCHACCILSTTLMSIITLTYKLNLIVDI